MVNTNWNLQGLAPQKGLRTEYVDQDQPMAGDSRIGVGEIHQRHDEERTVNRNYIFSLDYTFDNDWGIFATLPLIDRSHSHIHNHGGGQIPELWNFSDAGDIRVVGRRQWSQSNSASTRMQFYGINFGLKLPTGKTGIENSDGEHAERTLQPGTGTTDLLFGAYYSELLLDYGSSWFAQVQIQSTLDSHQDFRPGSRVSLDLGYRKEINDQIGLMLQLNLLHRLHDRGSEAEPDDSGGDFVFVSPGMSYAFTNRVQTYGFVQLPLYQYVNGVQLTADWAMVLGLSLRY